MPRVTGMYEEGLKGKSVDLTEDVDQAIKVIDDKLQRYKIGREYEDLTKMRDALLLEKNAQSGYTIKIWTLEDEPIIVGDGAFAFCEMDEMYVS